MLTLLSYIYWIAWSIRKKLYGTGILKVKRLPCPVISVGNITTGGTGKTPVVIALAQLLQNKTGHAAILTRGYKRRSKDPIIVVSDSHKILSTPRDSGDEPYLIASSLKKVPVIVGAYRYRTGRYAINNFGAKLFILDDGYQHIKLYRDIDILLIDASNPIGNGKLLPKGILREPLSEISRADCIIISRANEGDREYVTGLVRKYNKNSPVFYGSYKAKCLIDSNGNMYGLNQITGKTIFLFSGIGNPSSFRKSIEDIGGRVQGEIIFPDHYWYKEKDMHRIFEEAKRISADTILTTEKDIVRIIGTNTFNKAEDNIVILALQVEMELSEGFEKWIIGQVDRIRVEGRI